MNQVKWSTLEVRIMEYGGNAFFAY